LGDFGSPASSQLVFVVPTVSISVVPDLA